MGLTVNTIRGLDGKIEVKGLGAVVALIQKWTLERRVEDGSAGPTWTLRASLSYQNDVWLKAKSKRIITLNLDNKITYLAEQIGDPEWKIEGNDLVIEGVHVWTK